MLTVTVLDTETTCLQKAIPIEIATWTLTANTDNAFDFGRGISVCERYDCLDAEISWHASNVHGIYKRDLLGCVPYCDYQLPHTDIIIAHNAKFDIRVLNNTHHHTHSVINQAIVLDTLPLLRKLYPKLTNHKLETCVREVLNKNPDNAHNAGVDVGFVVALLQRVVEEFDIQSWLSLVNLSQNKGKDTLFTAMPYGQYKNQSFANLSQAQLQALAELNSDKLLTQSIMRYLKD